MATAYLGGYPVTLTVPLLDSAGAIIAATAVHYRVLDETDAEVVVKTAVTGFTEGDDSVAITVSDIVNALTAPNTREIRVVELYLTTAEGTLKMTQEYFIEAEEVLVEGTNSFQSYNVAMAVAFDLPNLPGWNNAATKQERIAALIRARQHIGKMRFTLYGDDISQATATEYAALDSAFRQSLCRAQVLEADYLLGGDEIGDIRRAGLMSMTVGEAKQFFRPAKVIEGPICKRALKELSSWVLTSKRLTRT